MKIIVALIGCLLIVVSAFASDVLIDSDGNVTTGVSNADGTLEVFGPYNKYAIIGSADFFQTGVYGESQNGQFGGLGGLYQNVTAGVYGYAGDCIWCNKRAGYFVGDVEITENLEVRGTITGYTETDPVFSASTVGGITAGQISNWDMAFGWGDHPITAGQITNWDTAFGWGDHASASYDTTNDSWTGTGDVYMTSGNVGIGTTPLANNKLYVYRPSGHYGPGFASIYGHRYGSSVEANGGTSWSKSGVDAAIKGANYWGNEYTAGVAGYSYLDFNNSAAVVGANYGGLPRGMLGYKDTSGIKWAGYFEGDVYASENLYVVDNVGIGLNAPGTHKLSVDSGLGGAASSSAYFENMNTTNGIALSALNWSPDTTILVTNMDWNGDLIRGDYYDSGGVWHRSFKVSATGRITGSVLELTGGADLAELFDITDPESITTGMVMSIDPDNPGQLRLSEKAYDRTVAGIVSGAGGIHAGMLMGQRGSAAYGAIPVSLTGRVYAWADASGGSIQPGDLLTTSTVPGHAMKVTDYSKAQGAIIGKAMTTLEDGKGLVLVLVSLQ